VSHAGALENGDVRDATTNVASGHGPKRAPDRPAQKSQRRLAGAPLILLPPFLLVRLPPAAAAMHHGNSIKLLAGALDVYCF